MGQDDHSGAAEPPPKKLGFFGRSLLMVAAMTKGITGIIRDDSRKSRAAFWGYMAAGAVIAPVSVALILLPGPNVLGVGLVLASGFLFAGGVKALDATGLSSWARERNRTHLKDVFNSAALVRRYDEYIQPKEGAPGTFIIRKKALFSDTFNRAGEHLSDVSPSKLRLAAIFTINKIIKPAMQGMSSVFNRMAGRTPSPPQQPEDKIQARDETPLSQDDAANPPGPPAPPRS